MKPGGARTGTLTAAEAAHRIAAACDHLVSRATRRHEPPVTCRPRCSWCCRQPVFISPLEGAAIREAVRNARRTDEVRRRTTAYLEELQARPGSGNALLTLLHAAQGKARTPTPAQRAAVFGPGCPFLDGGMCSIYPVRPLMCREHISFDDVAKCERDEPFFGLEKPRFEEVAAWLCRDVPAKERLLPVWEYERAARAAGRLANLPAAEVERLLKWKCGEG